MSIASTQDAIVLIGDSLTEFSTSPGGLTTFLTAQYVRKLDVINRGFGGWNTKQYLPLARNIFSHATAPGKPKVALMVLWLGTNDSVFLNGLPRPEPVGGEPRLYSREKIPLPDFLQNMRGILATLPAEIPKLLITPPCVLPEKWRVFKQAQVQDRSVENTKKYVDAIKSLGEELHYPVVDIWSAMEHEDLDGLLDDGLHLSDEGYDILNKLVLQSIVESYPQLAPSNILNTYPNWDVIDPNDVASAMPFSMISD